jgi:hypothetical protein
MNGLDKETLSIVTKELSPEKKARAALFLGRFEQHMMGGPGGRGGMGPGKGMRGGRGGRGMGGHGPGMGRGEMGMAGPHDACPNCPWEEDEE